MWMSLEDLADELKISKSTLYKMHGRGDLPPSSQFGKELRFLREDVLVWYRKRLNPDSS
jgi:excisionase family DNA binding protein